MDYEIITIWKNSKKHGPEPQIVLLHSTIYHSMFSIFLFPALWLDLRIF